MPSAFSSMERDEFGYTEDDYVRMMDDVASEYNRSSHVVGSRMTDVAAIVDEQDQNSSAPPVGGSVHPPSASYNVQASRGRDRGSVKQGSCASRPEPGTRFHPYNRPQQHFQPNAFGDLGDTYPTPPSAGLRGLNTDGQSSYRGSRSAYGGYGGTSSSIQFAQPNVSNLPSARSQHDTLGQQRRPLSWNQDQVPRPAMPLPRSSQRNPQYRVSRLHRNPAEFAGAQRFAAMANAPSLYAANGPYVNPHSQPQSNVRPNGQGLQLQSGSGGSRYPTVPAVDDEDEDGEYSSEEEEDEEAGEEQDVPMTKGTKKSKNAPKSRERLRRGLTRTNADGELKWFAKTDGKGGKIFSISLRPH